MAIEVAQNDHLFLPSDASSSETETDSSDGDAEEQLEREERKRASEPIFVHNEAHDIESLWWISVYMLVYFHSDVDPARSEARSQNARMMRIFSVSTSSTREHFFKEAKHFVAGTEWFPRSFKKIRTYLLKLRKLLVSRYIKFERAFPEIRKECFQNIPDRAYRCFEPCIVTAYDAKVLSQEVLSRKDDRCQNLSLVLRRPVLRI